MNNISLSQKIVVAADASGRVTFCPPDATTKWKLKKLAIVPNETSATNGTNYADITPKSGANALATTRSTSAASLTQGTPVNFTLTGTPTQLECTQAAPHHVLVDSTPGSGVAVDITVMAEYEVLR